jgi:hypothetical protein
MDFAALATDVVEASEGARAEQFVRVSALEQTFQDLVINGTNHPRLTDDQLKDVSASSRRSMSEMLEEVNNTLEINGIQPVPVKSASEAGRGDDMQRDQSASLFSAVGGLMNSEIRLTITAPAPAAA